MARSMLPSILLSTALAGAVAAAPAPPSDARIEAAVKRSYNFKVHLKDDPIRVAAKDGVVTLSGEVANGFHKSLAEATAADTPGVKSVVNDLTLASQGPAEASDAWITAKVKTALLYHRNVDAAGTRVETQDGVVTLSGEVPHIAQKALTEDVAANVDGVQRVVNHLKVVPRGPDRSVGEKIDDASVTAQVKASLLFHKGTRMLTTRVRTERGVVVVRGDARNPAEKELVTRLVSGVRGVRRVDNRMTVSKAST